MTLYPAAVIFLIEMRVSPMSGQCKTSQRRMVVVLFPFGILIHKSPFPIAWKCHLSAAVIGLGSIDTLEVVSVG